MEETLIKLGLNVYQVSGIIGVLVFFIAILIFILITFYARKVKVQALEVTAARDETQLIRSKLSKQLEDMLEDCEAKCKKQDLLVDELRATNNRLENQIATLKSNEFWYKNEIDNLERTIEDLRDEFPKTGKRPSRRRRTPP